jgi:Big-like domain-containing protein
MAARHGRGSRRRTSLAAVRTGLAGALVGSLLLLALPAAAATVPILAGGPPVTIDVSTPGDTAILTFDGSAGQRVSVDVSEVSIGTSTCCSTKVSILKPDGKPLVALTLGTNGGFIDATSLPAAGTYSIVVDPQSTNIGGATLTLYDVPPDASAAIVPGGAPVTVSTAVPGQNARVTFAGTSGERVSLDVSDVTVGTSVCCSTKISILKPDGKTLVGATVGTNGGFIDTQTLPSTGTYTILVDPQSSAGGDATLTLYDVPADAAGTIVPGGPDVTVSTTVPGQNARVTFDGVAGQRVSLDVSGVTIGTSLCCGIKVSIVRASGTIIAGPSTFGTLGGFVDTVSLPASGTYTILVDPQGSASGAATLTLHAVPADATGTIVPGGPGVTVSTTVPGQNARVTFLGVSGQRVSLEISGVSMGPSTCCSLKVSILKPNGSLLAGPVTAGTSGGFLDTSTLPTNGTYTIVVDPQGGVTGDASLTLYDVPADTFGSIVVGGPAASVGTSVPGQNAALTFSGTAGQRISLAVGPTCCSTKISIIKPNSTVLASATFSSFGGFLDATTLPTTGTYTVAVDLQGRATGDVTVRLYNVPADTTSTIAFGSSTTVTTTVPGQNATVTFVASAGQRMSLRIGPTCCSAGISVLKPNSSTLVTPTTIGTNGGFIDTTVLPTAGTYTIVIDLQSSATGSITLSLFDVPTDVSGTIAFGSPTTVTTTVPGQNGAVTFAGTAGQRVSVKIGPGCCTTKVSILRPDSSVLASLTSFAVLEGFIDATVLPVTGTYTIAVDPSGSSVGATTLTLYDVPADVADTITFGSSRTETLAVPGQNARVTFAGTAGQVASLQLTGVTIGNSVLSGTTVSILRPDSIVLASTSVGTNGGFIDSKTLPVTGDYTILVDPQGANTGSITLALADVPVDVTGTIVPGGPPLTVTTTISGQDARISFSGSADQRVSLQVGSSCCLAQLSILNPDGSPLAGPTSFGTGGGFIDSKTLPVTGNYTILFDPQGAATGSVTLTLYDVPPDAANTITAGGPAVGVTTTVPGQNAKLTFAGTSGQRVSVKANPGCCIATYSVLDPDGNAVAPPVGFGTGGGFIDTMMLPATGTYSIAVNPQGAVTGSVTINLYDVPADVTGAAVLGGAAVTVATTTPGQDAVITFTGAQNDGVSVVVGPFNCCSTRVSVLNPDGTTLAGPVAFNPDGGTMVARLPAAGTYTLAVDPQGAGFGSLHLRLAIDNTAPAPPVLSLSETSADGHVSGASYFYRPGGTGGTFTVTATASDPGTGIQKMTFPGLAAGFTPTILVEDKIVPYGQTYTWLPGATYSSASNTVTAYDNVGNTSSTNFVVVPDVDPPTTGDNTAAIGSGWKNTDQFVTLSALDGSGAGSARSHYTTDGSTPTTSSLQGTAITLSAEGVYTVKYFSIDNVGNVEAPKTAGTQIRIDKTPPTSATLGALPAVIKNSQTLTGSGSDALSGLGSVAYYYCAGSSCTPSTLIGTSSTAPSYTVAWSSQPADGTYQVLARAIDLAGNTLNSVKQTITIDNTPPTTTITAKPANPINSTSATFSFTASEPATFQCQLDGSAFASCSTPATYSGLAVGSHTFAVRATDAIGNVGVAATYTWTIDTSPPDTTITSSPANPSNSTSPSFSFSSSESGSTFQCSLDGAAFAGCTSPRAYAGLAPGSHTFQVKATDPAGNVDPTPASYTWTIDTAAPDTTITSSPANPSNSTSASFGFSSSEGGSTFECQLDAGGYSSCATPKAYSGLAPGSHTFQVRATDAAGNTDLTPASFTWTIDATAPDTTITTSPANPTSSTSVSFSFTSTEAGSFECQLDGAAFAGCTSPKAYVGLAAGSHNFQVRSTDTAGNTDPTPASYTWTIDTAAPDTTITASPANPTNSPSASFSFSSSEGGSTFECQLDGGGYSSCASPKPYSGLAPGSHTFQARATDQSGNTDPTPASYTWVIDIGAPDTTITASPANPTNSTSASFGFSSSEGGSTFECQLDGGGYSSCASPKPYSGVAPGSHTFQVKATDPAGNTDPTAASFTWVIDIAAPDTTITASPANPTNSTSASFGFSSSEGGSTFECQLGGGGYSSCASPKPYSGLTAGSHTFQVRSTDTAGNTDLTPASFTWTIDTAAPDTSIMASPANPTNSTSASFSFSSTEGGSTFECQLGSGGYLPCASPVSYSGLGEGTHSFQVKATDPAGNTDPTPASYGWTVDTSPPDTAIGLAPTNPTNATGATFSFTSSEGGSSFACSLDGAVFTACASPASYSALGDGSHNFQVRATDAAGNTDATPASRTWTIDTTPPAAPVIETPPQGATNNTGSFTLAGTAEPSATVEVFEGAASKGTTTASGVGSWAKALISVADGSHTYTARATDAAGNVSAVSNARTVVVDTTAPNTDILAGPSGSTASTTAIFSFSADDPAATFQCSLDGAAFNSCTSPKTYTGLGEGAHAFAVRATDQAGNTDPTPAIRSWTVDLTAPAAPVITSPPDGTTSNTGSFTVSGTVEAGAVVEVFDGATSKGTVSASGGTWTKAFAGVADGSHTYTAIASDTAGNTSGVSNSRMVIVDTTPPNTSVDSGPAATTNQTIATLIFSSSEGGSSFNCRLDGAAFASCTSPLSYSSLAEGSHTFEVKASDAAGNTDPTPATRSWTVDTSAPDTSIDSGPVDPTTDTTATFAFSSSQTGSTFECSLDGSPFASCSSPDVQTALDPGSHTFEVRATDPAGNTDESPALHAWTIT